jgi:hypothetical protein
MVQAMYVHTLSLYSRLYAFVLTLKPNAIKNARFSTEIKAGLITFLTMAYIIDVNVSTFSSTKRHLLTVDPPGLDSRRYRCHMCV